MVIAAVEPGVGHPLPGQVGLLGGQRDADDVGAVPLRGVQREAAPAAADVQQPHPGRQAELAADEVELGLLGGVQPGVLVGPDGAGVDQRGSEDQRVEVVADVVVVGDRGGVPVAGVPPDPARAAGTPRAAARAADRPRPARRRCARAPASSRARGPGEGGRRGQPADRAQRVQRREDVVLQVDVAGHVGPGETELAGRPHQPAERQRRPDRPGPGPRPDRPRTRPRRAAATGTSGAPRTVLTAAARRAATRRRSASAPRRRPAARSGSTGPGDRVLRRSGRAQVRSASCSTRATEVIRCTAKVRVLAAPLVVAWRKPPTRDTGCTTRWLPLPWAST